MKSCIIWGNFGPAVELMGSFAPQISYSCIDGSIVGVGTISLDPLLCGFADAAEVFVDSTAARPGRGSEAQPFADLAPALRWSAALAANSPCRGTGEGGSDMGARNGLCEEREVERIVRLAPGDYDLRGSLVGTVSLIGSGADQTIVSGTVRGLRSASVLSDLTITRGSGVIVGYGQAPRIENCTMWKNQRSGVFCFGEAAPYLERCTIRDTAGSGLAVYGSTATLSRCVILGNQASGRGSGVDSINSQVTLTNCVVAGNSGPGGTLSFLHSSARIVNSTISGNRSTRSDDTALLVRGSGLESELRNSIVWGNFTATPTVVEDANLAVTFSNVEGQPTQDTKWNAEPSFVSPGVFDFARFDRAERRVPDFIVEEPDFRLQEGSPMIDAGTPDGAPATDIVGTGRPCGDGVDMGAFEAGDCVGHEAFARGDSNADSAVNVTDVLVTLRRLFRAGGELSCEKSADVDDDGSVGLTDAIALLNYLFRRGPAPPAPFARCGIDPTPDRLSCERFTTCESR